MPNIKLQKLHMYSTVNRNQGKRKKVLGKNLAFEGCAIGMKGSEYKMQYEADESKFMVAWFSVRNTTSKTKFEDNSRRKRGSYQ